MSLYIEFLGTNIRQFKKKKFNKIQFFSMRKNFSNFTMQGKVIKQKDN